MWHTVPVSRRCLLFTRSSGRPCRRAGGASGRGGGDGARARRCARRRQARWHVAERAEGREEEEAGGADGCEEAGAAGADRRGSIAIWWCFQFIDSTRARATRAIASRGLSVLSVLVWILPGRRCCLSCCLCWLSARSFNLRPGAYVQGSYDPENRNNIKWTAQQLHRHVATVRKQIEKIGKTPERCADETVAAV